MDYSLILGVRVLPLHEAVAEGLVVRHAADATPVLLHVPGAEASPPTNGSSRGQDGGVYGAQPAVTVGRPFACVTDGEDGGEHQYVCM